MTRRVLFVCVHNAGRSQMAEAFFNTTARQRGVDAVAESAGTEPGRRVHSEVIDAMREAGLDLSGRTSKRLTNAMASEADRIVTMGCAVDAEACPAIFLKGIEDWGLPDPKGQPPDAVRRIRDEIRRRVDALLDEIASTGSP